jgi:hypothetical protein
MGNRFLLVRVVLVDLSEENSGSRPKEGEEARKSIHT